MIRSREPVIHLRPAIPANVELLRHWDDQPHVIASDPNDDWAWEVELGKHPDWREQLIGEVDGCPIGLVQIIDPAREESHYWGDVAADLRAIDIWIGEETYLGKATAARLCSLRSPAVLPIRPYPRYWSTCSPAICVPASSTSGWASSPWARAVLVTMNASSTARTAPDMTVRLNQVDAPLN